MLINAKVLHATGHMLLASGAYAGVKTVAVTQTAEKAVLYAQLKEPYIFIGIAVPYYWGFVFFILALIFGSALSVYQKTEVDDYVNHPKLKPIYSFFFSLFVTLFGIPYKFPEITIWQLILPAMVLAAVGSIVIYYAISIVSKSKIWKVIEKKLNDKAEGL